MNIKKCFAVQNSNQCLDFALLLIRVVCGIAFLFHGWGKIQNPFGWAGPDSPIPSIFLGLAALSEFGGGLAWVLGLLTPLASLGIAFTMIGAVYTHMIVLGDPFVSQGGGSWELAAVYLSIAILLMVQRAGRFSLDRMVFGVK